MNTQNSPVPPLYDIQKICSFKELNDPERDHVFAEITLPNKTLRYCTSSPQSQWRVNTLFTKEPITIDWLHSFSPHDVYVDIGANIGMYALYAGVVMGVRVYAFEPESQNYAEMIRSIFLNGAHGRMRAYCAAMGDAPVAVSQLLLNTMTTGGSFHDFGVPSRDYAAQTRFAQGSVAFSLDYLVESGAVPYPDHIKIDVDGHEHKVVAGMRGVLKTEKLRTVLLECDPELPHTQNIVKNMLDAGWVYNPDQTRLSSSGIKSREQIENEINEGRYAGNIVFARKADDLQYATAALNRFSAADLERMKQI